MSFRRILVGWDGSPDAAHALRAAVSLAAELRAEVLVLSVLKRPIHAESREEAEQAMLEHHLEVVHELSGQLSSGGQAGELRLRQEVVEADEPARALRQFAVEHGFDLLVVGRHGVDRARHPRIGGVTEDQVRHSPCPVLVVGAP